MNTAVQSGMDFGLRGNDVFSGFFTLCTVCVSQVRIPHAPERRQRPDTSGNSISSSDTISTGRLPIRT